MATVYFFQVQVEKLPESYDRGMTFQVPLDDWPRSQRGWVWIILVNLKLLHTLLLQSLIVTLCNSSLHGHILLAQ